MLHVITESFSAHAFLKPLVSYLREQEWDSVIACSARSYDDAHSFIVDLREDGFDVRDVDIPRRIDPIADVRQVARVFDLIRKERPSLVHTHLSKGGMVGRLAAWLANVPCVHTVYDYAFVEQRGIRRQIYRSIEWVGAALPRRILFVSENERALSLAAGIGRPEQLLTVGFGIDCRMFDPCRVTADQVQTARRRFAIPDGRLVIGGVARLIPRKGIDLLLRAAAELPGLQVDAHLLIVGGGPLRQELARLAAGLGLEGRITFAGFVDDQLEMPVIFRVMDIFCLPSRREGYGMVYAEAGAMERPTVAPNISPVNEIVLNGRTGLLVAPEDPAEIADALVRLSTDPPLRHRMGREAGKFVRQHCDMRDACSRVLQAYATALRTDCAPVRPTGLTTDWR